DFVLIEEPGHWLQFLHTDADHPSRIADMPHTFTLNDDGEITATLLTLAPQTCQLHWLDEKLILVNPNGVEIPLTPYSGELPEWWALRVQRSREKISRG
ncbi:MAG: hypothetical protein AAF226_18230, partial [Verrucomicrobiota bacterium]